MIAKIIRIFFLEISIICKVFSSFRSPRILQIWYFCIALIWEYILEIASNDIIFKLFPQDISGVAGLQSYLIYKEMRTRVFWDKNLYCQGWLTIAGSYSVTVGISEVPSIRTALTLGWITGHGTRGTGTVTGWKLIASPIMHCYLIRKCSSLADSGAPSLGQNFFIIMQLFFGKKW